MKIERKGILWTSKDVADYLGISEAQAEKLMQNGEIVSFAILSEKRLRTRKEAVDKWSFEMLGIKIK